MRGSNNIIQAIQHLKIASYHFESFINEHPASKGSRLFSGNLVKIKFVADSLITNPFLPEVVREGIKQEWNGDVLAICAIAEKASVLSSDQRDLVESFIEGILNGEITEFVANENK